MKGGSHDQPGILPIKAGVAIIYMGAVADHNADAQVIVCGINYDHGHKFRSTAIVEFGYPYRLSEETVKLYDDPIHKKEIVNDFLHKLSRKPF